MDIVAKLHQISSTFMEAKTLLAAVELGVFEKLPAEGATLDEAARLIGGSERGTEILLDALVALELLIKERRDDESAGISARWRVPEEVARQLGPEREGHLDAILLHRNRLFRTWAFLEEHVRGEKPPLVEEPPSSLEDPEANDHFIRAMAAVSGDRVPLVLDALPLEGVRLVADVGGGPGIYARAFAERLPDARVLLVDLPQTLETAARVLEGDPLGARIERVVWNFYEGPPPESFPHELDLILLSQVLHAEGAEENRALIRRLAHCLAPGGRLVVHEFLVDESRTAPPMAALFAVNMLANTPAGRTWTVGEIAAWGAEAGLELLGAGQLDERSGLVTLRRTP